MEMSGNGFEKSFPNGNHLPTKSFLGVLTFPLQNYW
eukprot:UN02779